MFNNLKKKIIRIRIGIRNRIHNLIIKRNSKSIINLFSIFSLAASSIFFLLNVIIRNHFGFLINALFICLSIPLMFFFFNYLFLNIFNKLIVTEKRMRKIATLDSMTNLPTRQSFMGSARTILSVTTRKKEPMTLLYIDVDDFKQLNDCYGHGGGDAILGELGSIIVKFIRESDACGRIGGEEFAVCGFVKDLLGAKHIAEKLIESVRKTKVKYFDKTISFTISVGITFLSNNDQHLTLNEILNQADIALYDSKESGKDKYTVYGE